MDRLPTQLYQAAVPINFDLLLLSLREGKPNDRSDRDRYWAITITEVEKAFAIFKTYAEENLG